MTEKAEVNLNKSSPSIFEVEYTPIILIDTIKSIFIFERKTDKRQPLAKSSN